ncbi:hypothetical protein GGX14DRAFT_407930 [Mycena pura]|uniref:Uncharacterized protein n=1 Tax=Mycena pura TaxID=153505 RepID=A0AAD6XWJ7_9AGAR|nr:hypothetical protein GGX14DRAFT_407930 [Mycena pura]
MPDDTLAADDEGGERSPSSEQAADERRAAGMGMGLARRRHGAAGSRREFCTPRAAGSGRAADSCGGQRTVGCGTQAAGSGQRAASGERRSSSAMSSGRRVLRNSQARAAGTGGRWEAGSEKLAADVARAAGKVKRAAGQEAGGSEQRAAGSGQRELRVHAVQWAARIAGGAYAFTDSGQQTRRAVLDRRGTQPAESTNQRWRVGWAAETTSSSRALSQCSDGICGCTRLWRRRVVHLILQDACAGTGLARESTLVQAAGSESRVAYANGGYLRRRRTVARPVPYGGQRAAGGEQRVDASRQRQRMASGGLQAI